MNVNESVDISRRIIIKSPNDPDKMLVANMEF